MAVAEEAEAESIIKLAPLQFKKLAILPLIRFEIYPGKVSSVVLGYLDLISPSSCSLIFFFSEESNPETFSIALRISGSLALEEFS